MCTLFWRKSPFDDVHASHSIRFRSTIKKIRIEKIYCKIIEVDYFHIVLEILLLNQLIIVNSK